MAIGGRRGGGGGGTAMGGSGGGRSGSGVSVVRTGSVVGGSGGGVSTGGATGGAVATGTAIAAAAATAGTTAGAAAMSNNTPSGACRYRTGVPHSSVSSGGRKPLPRLGQRRVDRDAPGDRLVERSAELDRGVVGDLVLHRHDRGRALADEGAGRAREQVRRVRSTAFARVEDRETQRLVIAQHASDARRPLVVGLPIGTGEGDDPLLAVLVEATVADEVEDVPRALPQRLLHVRPCLSGDPLELDDALALERREGGREPASLSLDVEPVEVGRTDPDGEDPDRRCHAERRHALGQRDVADQRRAGRQGDEIATDRVEEVLPRERRELRIVAPELDPDAGLLVLRLLPACLVARQDVAGEERRPQLLAELLDGAALR